MKTIIEFPTAIAALIAKHGVKWLAAEINQSACPGTTDIDVEIAKHEGAWDRENRRAVESLIVDLYEREFGPFPQPQPAKIDAIELRDCKKTGLFPEHDGIGAIEHMGIRATIPVIELLRRTPGVSVHEVGEGLYDITISEIMPPGIYATTIHRSGQVGLRLENEPEYPGEYYSIWERLEWTPCPKCGGRLVWYEAGYAAGYRVCAKKPHHHWQA